MDEYDWFTKFEQELLRDWDEGLITYEEYLKELRELELSLLEDDYDYLNSEDIY